MTPLPRGFFARSALVVAPDLLGCVVVREIGEQRLIGRILETEAYLGETDAASHAYRGPTPRSRMMFGLAGLAYIYFIYGNHYCLNAVTGAEGEGQAVLIRALEPLAGIEFMRERRGQHAVGALAGGPGKLCQAFGIDRTLNGHDLTLGLHLWLEPGPPLVGRILTGPRVGVRGDEAALCAPWRFCLRDEVWSTEY